MKKDKKESRSVRIDLDEEWKLGSDSIQWILYKKGEEHKKEFSDEVDKSKQVWTKGFHAVGFFTTLENALKAYIDAKLRNSAAKSIKELYDCQQEIIRNLNDILKPFEIVIRNNANSNRYDAE